MTFAQFWDMLSLPAVTRAIFAGVLISMCAAVLGVVLVLKRYSLIGHGLADVGFASMALALALGLPPVWVSMPVVIVASFCIMAYSQKKGMSGDTAIGVAATASLAAGILITAMSSGFNTDVYGFMFGSIVALDTRDVWMSAGLGVVVVGLFILFYNRIFIVTMDEGFARAAGLNVTGYQFLISFLTALTVVIGMRLTGTMLISSLIIFPVMTARKLTKSFLSLVVTSAVVSVLCFLAGMTLSLLWNLPVGAGIVAVNVALMVVAGIAARFLRKNPA